MKVCTFFFAILAFLFLSSCKNAAENSRQKLLDAFKDQKVDSSWNFETTENDSIKTSAFKNKAIGEQIVLQARDTSLVIGYFSHENKRTQSSTMYKSQLVRRDSLLYVVLNDPSGKQIDKVMLPAAKKTLTPTQPTPGGSFGSFEKCFYDFNCKERSQLQCLANETCKPVRADIDCCLPDGQCYSILIVINPTRLICSIAVIDMPPIFAIE
ncbi:MAG TPA: hypothetical protein VFP87_11575 [Chitinophagaceae bacterium]|nr:hypothetical protein [Chitinophagaceae bacterium]